MDFHVFRNHATPPTFHMVYSCTDYGTAFKASDEVVLNEVKRSSSHQATLVNDDGTCKPVGIFVGVGGYVVGSFDRADWPKERIQPVLKTREEKAEYFGKLVADRAQDFIDTGLLRPGHWCAEYGQWLVYGMERSIGFNNGVELCAAIEHAWKAGKPLAPVASELFLTWTKQ